MRLGTSARVVGLAAALAGAAAMSLVASCGDSGATDDGGAEADTNVGPAPLCVVSPDAAPFPSGTCNSPQPSAPDSFDEALAAVGLDRCSVTMDPKKMPQSVMLVNDTRRLADFTPLLQYPLRLPAYGAETARWLDDALAGATPVTSAIAAAAERIGAPVSVCADPSWFVVDAADAAPLSSAIGELYAAYGADFDPDATSQLVAGVPIDLQRALVPVVRALSAAGQAIADARAPASGFMPRFLVAPDWVRGIAGYQWTTQQLQAWDAINVGEMAQAALWVASAVEAAQLSRFAGQALDPITIDTPLGPILLHGAGPDDYEPGSGAENALLLLDTGGDDIYRVPVAATTNLRTLSINIDLGGKDLYGYVEKADPADGIGHRLPSDGAGRNAGITRSKVLREGAALLGVGMLWDYGQDGDTYRSLTASQGVGIFGVGVLYDEGGDDDYGGESLVQGGAAWGIGLLLDKAGNDKYVAYSAAQGFGFTRGFGGLVDEAGNDTYLTDPGDPAVGGDPIYPNAQLPGVGNTSMSQGCGEGHRPDSPDPGWQFAGGMGVLRDAQGSDSYVTSVFGQACSFAMGIGMLLEGGGDDTYEGLWYVQGSAAHTGIAYFDDKAGNDKYNPTFPIRATSIGVGHDYSSVLHYDEGGDDTYHGPGLSLGSGNDNGIGMMLVTGGSDTFNADYFNTLGAAQAGDLQNTSRRTIQTLGVFVKASGTATYTVGGGVDAGSYPSGSWSYAPDNTDGGADGGVANFAEKSIGMDRPSGTASWP